MDKNIENSVADQKFGMFKAVFTPSILTILGVIMYQRLGWVVGNGGLINSLIIIALAHIISITTGLSIASIATSRTVKAGGNYYIISRSLGLAVGGAIGIAFYLALSISIALYLIGFAESFSDITGIGSGIWGIRIIAIIILILLTGLTLISTSFALKTQYFVLLAIALSIVSLFTGSEAVKTEPVQLWSGENSESFEYLFAVFFPAVTGFTAGVAMSGDLKNPRKSIPLGTILSIFVGMAVYVSIALFLAFKVNSKMLIEDRNIWFNISSVPALVAAGVWGATLSSALGCILGGPRTLQALAMDRVVPKVFIKGRGALNEPTWALYITVLIAAVTILTGELNFIARVLSMAFLTVYAFINLSYGLERWTNSPAFRPSFKVSHSISFIGAITAFLLMFKLDMFAMIAATLFMAIFYILLKRKALKGSAGDTWESVWSAIVRWSLLKLKHISSHGRNWRPNAVVMGGSPAKRGHLISLADWLVQDMGIITYFYIYEGDIRKDRAKTKTIIDSTIDFMEKQFPHIFVKLDICKNVYSGMRTITQTYSIPSMETNTVIMGWLKQGEQERKTDFSNLLLDLMLLEKNLLILNYNQDKKFGSRNSIDIWWGGLENNGVLMLTTAGLISSSRAWDRAKIRIIVVVDQEHKIEEITKELNDIIDETRIKATPKIISKKDDSRPINEIIEDISKNSSLVMLGLRKPEVDDSNYVDQIDKFTKNLGTVLHVKASDELTHNSHLLFSDEKDFEVDKVVEKFKEESEDN